MKLCLMIYFLVTSLTSTTTGVTPEAECVNEKVCLTVVSQRWLTERELEKVNPLAFQSIAIRLRLRNESDVEIEYLAGFGRIEPYGYRLYRKLGDKQWRFLPDTGERSESLFLKNNAGTPRYLRLQSKSAIEFELADWSNPSRGNENEKGGYDEEHAFSIFVKLGGSEASDAPIELVTKPFLPLKK